MLEVEPSVIGSESSKKSVKREDMTNHPVGLITKSDPPTTEQVEIIVVTTLIKSTQTKLIETDIPV